MFIIDILILLYFIVSLFYIFEGFYQGFQFFDSLLKCDLSVNVGRVLFPLFWLSVIMGMLLAFILMILHIRIL